MTAITCGGFSVTKSGLGALSAICFAAFACSSESKTISAYPKPFCGSIQ